MADIVFLAMMVITVGGAILALEASEVVYAAVALAGSLFGVAALFFLLNAPFVGAFQIIVYVGAVAVLILFTVMLVGQEHLIKEVSFSLGKLAGALTAVAIGIALIAAFAASRLAEISEPLGTATYLQIGQLISTQFAPALQVMALVLAASVVGALTLAKIEGEEDKT
ncbi:MAG: NADH-quinone oxidoreductase subunit J [Thaumarchaeota archaeon]|nr:NADH-quinone oxidoreductase subunit J [Nitrososphaerota archaeon]